MTHHDPTWGPEVLLGVLTIGTRWRPNPYAREDADFAQQNIRTLLRPFSHQAAANADQDSHSKGDLGL